MAAQRVKPVGISDLRFDISVADGITSDWYVLPSNVKQTGVLVIPGAGGATLEITMEPDFAKLEAGSATPLAWPEGSVTGPTETLLKGVSAIRLVSQADPAVANINMNIG